MTFLNEAVLSAERSSLACVVGNRSFSQKKKKVEIGVRVGTGY